MGVPVATTDEDPRAEDLLGLRVEESWDIDCSGMLLPAERRPLDYAAGAGRSVPGSTSRRTPRSSSQISRCSTALGSASTKRRRHASASSTVGNSPSWLRDARSNTMYRPLLMLGTLNHGAEKDLGRRPDRDMAAASSWCPDDRGVTQVELRHSAADVVLPRDRYGPRGRRVHGHAGPLEEVAAVVGLPESLVRAEVVQSRWAAFDDPVEVAVERDAAEHEEERSYPTRHRASSPALETRRQMALSDLSAREPDELDMLFTGSV